MEFTLGEVETKNVEIAIKACRTMVLGCTLILGTKRIPSHIKAKINRLRDITVDADSLLADAIRYPIPAKTVPEWDDNTLSILELVSKVVHGDVPDNAIDLLNNKLRWKAFKECREVPEADYEQWYKDNYTRDSGDMEANP